MFKRILLWFTVNALLPVLVPVVFLATLSWFKDGTFPIMKLFYLLIDSGFYIFSAATLVFSLYEEYDICKRCIGLVMQTVLVLLLIMTLGMFYQIQNNSADYVNAHHLQFYVVWIMTAFSAAIVKYRILDYKKKLRI